MTHVEVCDFEMFVTMLDAPGLSGIPFGCCRDQKLNQGEFFMGDGGLHDLHVAGGRDWA